MQAGRGGLSGREGAGSRSEEDERSVESIQHQIKTRLNKSKHSIKRQIKSIKTFT